MHDNRRSRLVLGVLLIAAIAVITLDFKDGGASPVRRVGATVFGPVERVTHDVTNPVASLFDSVTGGSSEQGTIAALQRQNADFGFFRQMPYQPRTCIISDSCSFEISNPGMASPSSSLASSSLTGS